MDNIDDKPKFGIEMRSNLEFNVNGIPLLAHLYDAMEIQINWVEHLILVYDTGSSKFFTSNMA